MQKKYEHFVRVIASSWMFGVSMALFTIETVWLALTSRFPMAFDEAYHFGRIQFFSHQLNPIVTSQSSGTYRLGAIAQDPSFLYHYLLSFPYRLVHNFTASPVAEVICLRLLNVAMAIGTLLLLRKVLRLLQIPNALANLLLLVFALTPVVTILSAQINYDNLFVLLTTFSLYLLAQFLEQLRKNVVDTRCLLTLLASCLFASLVKYAFLPLFLGIWLTVMYAFALYSRRAQKSLWRQILPNFGKPSWLAKGVLLAAVLTGTFLFCRFYAVNLIRYHNPVPQCNQVLDVQDCSHYYAWMSNYTDQQSGQRQMATGGRSFVRYNSYWTYVMTADSFGTLKPLSGVLLLSPVFLLGVFLLATGATVAGLATVRLVIRTSRYLPVLLAISLLYLLFLWGRNYHDYLQLGVAKAIHGRYAVAVLPYFYTFFGLAVYYALRGRQTYRIVAKTALIVATLCLFVLYGGFTQYVRVLDHQYGRLGPTNSFVLQDTCVRSSGGVAGCVSE